MKYDIFFTEIFLALMDNIIEICAVMIASCALILSVFESQQNRKHHRLMVAPHLEVHRTISPKEQYFMIKIMNEGLGPAFINTIKFHYGGVERNLLEIRSYLNSINGNTTLNLYDHDENTVLKEGKEIKYLCIQFNSHKKLREEEIIKINSKINIEIYYRSMYKEEFVTKG